MGLSRERLDMAWVEDTASGSFGAPSAALGISLAGSDARITAQLPLPLARFARSCSVRMTGSGAVLII
jgi:hypothetical protein